MFRTVSTVSVLTEGLMAVIATVLIAAPFFSSIGVWRTTGIGVMAAL